MFCRKKPNLRHFSHDLSRNVEKRIGQKFLVQIYAARKSHRLCQPGQYICWSSSPNSLPPLIAFSKGPHSPPTLTHGWAEQSNILKGVETRRASVRSL